jgi:hypothetical protein
MAHAIDNKVEAVYRRGDLFNKRRRLMEAWASIAIMTASAADPCPDPLRAVTGRSRF